MTRDNNIIDRASYNVTSRVFRVDDPYKTGKQIEELPGVIRVYYETIRYAVGPDEYIFNIGYTCDLAALETALDQIIPKGSS
jgi:hypothetical protein